MQRVQAKLAAKDEYTFGFAELSPEYSGNKLEMRLPNNANAFPIEMDGDFTFVSNQGHLVVESRELYINLLLFHKKLKSLSTIELKQVNLEQDMPERYGRI